MSVNETHSLDDQIIGASYIFLGVIIAIFYIPCLMVIRSDNELKNLSCLRVMFHLGVSDLLHVTSLVICGILSFTGYGYTMPLWFNRLLINVIVNLSWYSYLILLNILSLNRCVAFNCNELWNDRLFGKKATTTWITVCWLWAFLWMAFHLTPWGGYVYYPNLWTYYFDFSTPIIEEEMLVNLINCIFHISCIWVWCIFAIIGFKKQVNDFGVGGNASMRKKERSLLIQSVVICAMLFVMDQYWHNIHSDICPSTFLYCGVIGQYLMFLNDAINPILYLTVNKTIKKKVLTMIGMNNAVESTRVIELK